MAQFSRTTAQIDAILDDVVAAKGSSASLTAALSSVTTAEAADRAALVELIDSGAKNLVNTSDAVGYNYQTAYPCTIAGVTYTQNADGSITTSGSTSATRVFKIPVSLKSGRTYVISGCPAGGSDNGYRVDIRLAGTSTVSAIDYGEGVTFTASQTDYDLCIRYPSAKTPAETFKLMVCAKAAWDISHTYVPYLPDYAALYAMVQALQ